MKILLLGKNGQVGWELQRSLSYLGDVVAVDFDSEDFCGDFSKPRQLVADILRLKPDVIVNAAAHTAVDKAESEPEFAYQLNSHTVEEIAKVASELNCWFVHYSTDYVFNGSGCTGWIESDIPSPLNMYGESKLAGERAIVKYCQKYLVFRTSWVFASRGNNFAKTMLNLAKSREELSIINDQFGAPTSAELLADCTAHAITVAMERPEVSGLYHLVASGETTWFDYAQYIFDFARRKGVELVLERVQPVPTSTFPTPAKRPHNSRLDTSKFENTFQLTLPHWKLGVERMIVELTEL